MGYYPSGQDEFDEEQQWLRLERDGYYICNKCSATHNHIKCPECGSTSKRNNI